MASTKAGAMRSDGEAQQFLTFMSSGEMFAFGILRVKEIIELSNVTGVPMMPEFIRGVINLRGNVVPVIDLAARFGRGITAQTRRTCIIVLEVGGEFDRHDIGVVVDSVSEVLEIGADAVEAAPAFGAKVRADFITGMGRLGDGRFVIILDIEKVLSSEELTALARMAGEGERERAA